MMEQPPNNLSLGAEGNQEKTPSVEEIKAVFEKLLQGKPFKELRVETDEHGFKIYEIEVTQENGGTVEYNFQRIKDIEDYKSRTLSPRTGVTASIHATEYYPDGKIDGEHVADYRGGEWEYQK